MLTSADIESLNRFARELALQSFNGAGKVERRDGIVRLTILRPGGGGATLYQTREMYSASFETASLEISLTIEAAREQM